MKTEKDIEQLFEKAQVPDIKPELKQRVLTKASAASISIKREAIAFRFVKWAIAACILITVLVNIQAGIKDRNIHALTNGAKVEIANPDMELHKEMGLPSELAEKATKQTLREQHEERIRTALKGENYGS
jgi:negative regulator of sigma E activity